MTNLAQLEIVKKAVDEIYQKVNDHKNKSQFSIGYCLAMKEVSNYIAGLINTEIINQQELLNVMYNDESGEDK